jgi:hypothetical protein
MIRLDTTHLSRSTAALYCTIYDRDCRVGIESRRVFFGVSAAGEGKAINRGFPFNRVSRADSGAPTESDRLRKLNRANVDAPHGGYVA